MAEVSHHRKAPSPSRGRSKSSNGAATLNSADLLLSCSLPYLHVQPQVIHFPAHTLNHAATQKITVINKGSSKVRLQARLLNSNACFSLHMDKKSYLHPGGSQTVIVQFQPTEYKHYSAKVRLASDAGDYIEIPVHGFPVINEIHLPKKLDVGRVPLGTTKTITLPLQSSVPIDFDYRLEVLESTPKTSWIIHNAHSGVVKGNSRLEIKVSFTPLSQQTCQLRFRLFLSQFGFEPMLCELYGYGEMPSDSNVLLEKASMPNIDTKKNFLKYLREFESASARKSPTLRRSPSPRERTSPQPKSVSQSDLADTVVEATEQQVTRTGSPAKSLAMEDAVKDDPTAKLVRTEGKIEAEIAAAVEAFHVELREKRKYEQLKDLRRFVCIGDEIPDLPAQPAPDEPTTETQPQVSMSSAQREFIQHQFASDKTQTSHIRIDHNLLSSAQQTSNNENSVAVIGRWGNKYRYQEIFRRAIWKVVLRLRAETRLAAIRKLVKEMTERAPESSNDK